MSVAELVIIRTGCGNLASVAAAFERLSVPIRISDDYTVIADAKAVVLPGVGNFGPAMRWLRGLGIDDALRLRVEADRPLLAICLGMQLLCDGSDEGEDVPGLGVIPGRVHRFVPDSSRRVPQMGWNRIFPTTGAAMLEPASMYFANSFRLSEVPSGWAGATSEHGGSYAAAIERGGLLACQFHPELSAMAGTRLLERWLRAIAKGGTP